MKTYNVIINNQKQPMSYEEICAALHVSQEVHFVRVTTAGTITFTTGKPDEIRFLYQQCREKGFRPSQALEYTVKHI